MNSDKSLCDPVGDRKMHGLLECKKQEKSPINMGKDFQTYVTRKRPPSPIKWLQSKNMSKKKSSWLPNIQSFASYCCTIMNILAIFPEEAPSAIFIGANLCFCQGCLIAAINSGTRNMSWLKRSVIKLRKVASETTTFVCV